MYSKTVINHGDVCPVVDCRKYEKKGTKKKKKHKKINIHVMTAYNPKDKDFFKARLATLYRQVNKILQGAGHWACPSAAYFPVTVQTCEITKKTI